MNDSSEQTPLLRIQNLTRQYPSPDGDGQLTVFENANFDIQRGEFVCIIGHSGCGKSTIMNILAGLDKASDGAVIMDNQEISGPSLDRGVVFQNYSLLPWMSALNNVIFGVKARFPDWTRKQVRSHAYKHLKQVGLVDGAENRKPAQLSGGMRQRVSIARAFAIQPKLLLLDEPFGALDALTRGTIQDQLIEVWSGSDQTVFMITHDVDEAMLLADRILLMSNGPMATVAESVVIDIPRPRNRADIIHHPAYYATRNHLVDFLTTRSKQLALQNGGKATPKNQFPTTVYPASSGDVEADSEPESDPTAAGPAAVMESNGPQTLSNERPKNTREKTLKSDSKACKNNQTNSVKSFSGVAT